METQTLILQVGLFQDIRKDPQLQFLIEDPPKHNHITIAIKCQTITIIITVITLAMVIIIITDSVTIRIDNTPTTTEDQEDIFFPLVQAIMVTIIIECLQVEEVLISLAQTHNLRYLQTKIICLKIKVFLLLQIISMVKKINLYVQVLLSWQEILSSTHLQQMHQPFQKSLESHLLLVLGIMLNLLLKMSLPTQLRLGKKTTITPSAPSLPPNFRADVLKPSPLLHGEIISKDVNMAAPQRFQQKIAKSTLNPPNKVRNNNSNPGNVDTNKNSTIYNTNIGANTSINSGMDSTKVPIANKKNPDNPDRTNIPRDEGQTSRIQQLKSQSPHSIPYSKNKGLSGHANAVLNSVPPPVRHHPPATASSSSNNQYQTNSYHRNLTYVRKNTTTENKNSYNNIKSNENNRYNYGANNANSPKRYSNNNQMYHRNLNNEHGYNKSTMPFTKKGQRPLVNHYSNHNEKSFVNKDNFVSTMEKPALVSKFAEGFDKNRLSNIQVDSNFNKRDLSRKNSGPLPSSPSRKRYRPISPSIHHAPHHTPQHPQQHQHPPPHHIHSHKQSLQQQYHAQKSHSSNYAVHSDSNLQKLPPPHLHPPLPQDVPGLNKKSSTIQSPPPPQKIVLPNQNVSSPKSSDVKSKGSESGTVQSPTTTITPGSPKAAPPSSSILALSRYIDASSQMEFAYAKFLYLSKKHDNIKKKIEFVQSLPIGQECFHDDLEALQLNSPNIDLNELGINLKRNRRSLGSSDRKRRSATSSSSNGKERHSIG